MLVYEWALKAYTTMLDWVFKICGKSFQLRATSESKKKLKLFTRIDPQTCKPFAHPPLTCNAFGRLFERTYNIQKTLRLLASAVGKAASAFRDPNMSSRWVSGVGATVLDKLLDIDVPYENQTIA